MQNGFKVEELRDKYAAERQKRMKVEQNDQWIDIAGDFAEYAHDPYVEPGFARDPIEEDVEVLVIGGGFGGLFSAAKLKQIGIDNIRIVEKAGDFGGTWYWNRYPGVQCDVESYIYLPLLDETGYVPTEKYAHGQEILEHTHRVADYFGLRDRALFQTRVTDLRWSEEDRLWTIGTDRGDSIRARFVISSSGPLNRPHLPGIPGIQDFKGKAFHTSRWDYDYTGGHARGGMDKLADKRVAVIGTGATAVQAIPYLAESAKHLYVVQRTPSTIGKRGNSPTDPEWVKSLEPGWQRRRSNNFEAILEGDRPEENMVDDGWTTYNIRLRPGPDEVARMTPEELAAETERRDFECGEDARKLVEAQVADKDLAEALKPWYRTFCKRPTFNDGYYPAFNRTNVTLVDTKGQGVERITEKGFVVDGVEYEVDCIVYATGFDTGTQYTKKAEYEVYGVGGRTLTEHHAKAPRTLHGFYAHGFPNYFILGVSQNGNRANFTHMLDEQTDHVMAMIEHMRANGYTRLEVTAEGEEEWQQVIRDSSKARLHFLTSCTPGYYNGYGDLERGFFLNNYNLGANRFIGIVEAWRATGDYDGVAFA